MTRTVQQIDADINAINTEAKRLTTWSKQNQSSVDAGAQYFEQNHDKFASLVEERFWAVWTPEFYATAKAKWLSCFAGKSANMLAIRAAEKQCGFLMSDIKKAKARHEA